MSKKLLLADDSVTIQRVIELTFADEDVDVCAVSSGQQAMDRIAAEPPDIVLADVGMPDRDGYEVAEYVKSRPELSGIPVLLLTGAFEPVDEKRAREARCDGVLAKPFEPQLLIARVKELLSRKREPAAAEAPHPELPPEARPAAETPSEDEDLALEATQLLQATANRPPEADVSLDDYFDRLDQAFATLAGGNRGTSHRPAESASAFESVFTPAARPGSRPPAAATSAATGDPSMHPLSIPIPVADAFASMLEAETSQPAGPAEAVSAAAPAVLVHVPATEDIIEQVTRRVLDRLTDRALREAVNDIVLATAERMVREELERTRRLRTDNT